MGAFFVNGAKSWFTQAFPEFWLYFLGGLFIAVTLFLPNGIVGLVRKLTRRQGRGAARMTPDLMEAGVAALRHAEVKRSRQRKRRARDELRADRATRRGWTRPTARILYLDDITVSFDGFKALNALT